MDEIKIFHSEDCYSVSNLELEKKVCTLFGLILRGIQSYAKNIQLVTAENSAKLEGFIVTIYEATKLCIHMNFFDRQDSLTKVDFKKFKKKLVVSTFICRNFLRNRRVLMFLLANTFDGNSQMDIIKNTKSPPKE